MDRLAELGCLAVLLCLLPGLSEARLGSDYLLDVKYECPPQPSGTVRVIVKTDIPGTHPFAVCSGGISFDLVKLSFATWCLDISFHTPKAEDICGFYQTESEKYYVNLHVPMTGTRIVTSDEPTKRIVCNFNTEPDVPKNLISNVVQSKKPLKLVLGNMGPVSKSDVALSLADVTGTPLKGRLNIGKLVILKAVLVGNHPTEASFHALSCKAICNKKEYVILNAGCGDGTVISQRKGFITKGKVAVSPIFRFFRMDLNKPVMFQCTFIICKNCDGNSCEDPDRHKRHLSTSERRPEVEKGKHIITARVVVPPFREPPLITHQHSVVPVGISSRLEAIDVVPGSEAARGIPGSEAARGIPGSEAARGIPGSEAARGIPGSEAARGIPGSEAARGIPGSEAARGIPGSEASRGIPASEAARDIPGTWDLVLTILVAVIIPLVFLVVIMLIFVIAISRALRSLSVLYKDVDRLRREVVVDDVKEDVKKDVQVDIKAILG